MKLGEIRETLFQILTMISDEETKLFLRQDMQSLMAMPGTFFYINQGIFKDLKTDFVSYLSNDVNALRRAHARDVTKEIHKPECIFLIKESGSEWEEDTQYPQVVVDPFIPLKTDGLTEDEIAVNELPIDAEDVTISFNYSVKNVLNYLVKEGLLVIGKGDFSRLVGSEPESIDEESDESIGNVHSDEEATWSEGENSNGANKPTMYQEVAEVIEPHYTVNIDRLFEFRTGLASGKNNPFYLNFEKGLRTAVEEHYHQIENNAKQTTLGKIIAIEEISDDTLAPQDSSSFKHI